MYPLQVILQAVHCVSSRECTPRTCGVILNIINCLLDLNVIEKKTDAGQAQTKDAQTQNDADKRTPGELNHHKSKKPGAKKDREKEKETKKEEKDKKGKEEDADKKEKPTCHAVAMETIIRWGDAGCIISFFWGGGGCIFGDSLLFT